MELREQWPLDDPVRLTAIEAVGKVRNDSGDCACDGCLVDAVLSLVTPPTRGVVGRMNDDARLRLLEDALRDRDWMRVMDVVEDLGGNWRTGERS